MRILIVEDYELNAQVLSLILKNLGYQSDIATNGKEAVEMYINNPYQLIFMDIRMPIMDGIEASNLIIDFEQKNIIKKSLIIALSAGFGFEDLAKPEYSIFDKVILKPISSDEIKNIFTLF
ncbi:MAG: hypothetical protein AUJ98_06955 [Bacteroidetes bacterium CG2_30_33_31]|nr:MAG: hypothetical protein AUJ98_06955 [Bacteroidetes bacterium CG2_30_33_31]